jgi:hypothetical protein
VCEGCSWRGEAGGWTGRGFNHSHCKYLMDGEGRGLPGAHHCGAQTATGAAHPQALPAQLLPTPLLPLTHPPNPAAPSVPSAPPLPLTHSPSSLSAPCRRSSTWGCPCPAQTPSLWWRSGGDGAAPCPASAACGWRATPCNARAAESRAPACLPCQPYRATQASSRQAGRLPSRAPAPQRLGHAAACLFPQPASSSWAGCCCGCVTSARCRGRRAG